MDLVRQGSGDAEMTIDKSLAQAAQRPNDVVLSSIKTVRGNFTALPVEIRRNGTVTYDTRSIRTVSVRIAGRVEKMYVKYLYQHVSKGQKVAEIYSPELVTAQRELIHLIETDPQNTALITAAKQRLRYMGMTSRQVDQVVSGKEPISSVAVYSPFEGLALQRDAQPPAAPLQSGSMDQSDDMSGGLQPSGTRPASAATQNADRLVREGAYVAAGQSLFDIANLSAVLVEINMPGTIAGYVRVGDEITLSTGTQPPIKTRIDLVQPFVGAGDQFIKIRTYVNTSKHRLTIGQLVSATLQLKPVEGLWVPTSAILDLGTRHIAFVKEGDHFVPLAVDTGLSNAEQTMVTGGIASGDEIAINAQFLADNEGFINVP
jgi:hypothetical protein